ncbi:hypothetical protein PHET_08828 [Paragonimus heterotremus]|uniref:Uncharacterized protein n=1 Tax=Paragonimus heterotremus TaxID=100268 RepID=A0A8J4SW98_9TREM|nr:hypothetical protein PHET_08828 [Paragonimus heterotremus]
MITGVDRLSPYSCTQEVEANSQRSNIWGPTKSDLDEKALVASLPHLIGKEVCALVKRLVSGVTNQLFLLYDKENIPATL